MLLLSQLHFIELLVEISIFFGLQKKAGRNIGQFVTLQITIRTSARKLITKFSRRTPNLEKKV